MNKLPRVTLLFWIMKIAATTLGETAGDLLSMTLKVGYRLSSMILIGLFLVSLVTQLRSKRYHPALYWTVILSTSTAGTTIGKRTAEIDVRRSFKLVNLFSEGLMSVSCSQQRLR